MYLIENFPIIFCDWIIIKVWTFIVKNWKIKTRFHLNSSFGKQKSTKYINIDFMCSFFKFKFWRNYILNNREQQF